MARRRFTVNIAVLALLLAPAGISRADTPAPAATTAPASTSRPAANAAQP